MVLQTSFAAQPQCARYSSTNSSALGHSLLAPIAVARAKRAGSFSNCSATMMPWEEDVQSFRRYENMPSKNNAHIFVYQPYQQKKNSHLIWICHDVSDSDLFLWDSMGICCDFLRDESIPNLPWFRSESSNIPARSRDFWGPSLKVSTNGRYSNSWMVYEVKIPLKWMIYGYPPFMETSNF